MQTIEDKLEIQEMMARYGRCVDTADWDGLRALFTDDAHMEHGVVTPPLDGGDTLIVVAQQLSALMENAQHYVTNVEVTVDGDRANALAFVYAMHDVVLDGERQLVPAGGRYENTFVRTPAGWKIAQVLVHETWLDERVEKIYAQ